MDLAGRISHGIAPSNVGPSRSPMAVGLAATHVLLFECFVR